MTVASLPLHNPAAVFGAKLPFTVDVEMDFFRSHNNCSIYILSLFFREPTGVVCLIEDIHVQISDDVITFGPYSQQSYAVMKYRAGNFDFRNYIKPLYVAYANKYGYDDWGIEEFEALLSAYVLAAVLNKFGEHREILAFCDIQSREREIHIPGKPWMDFEAATHHRYDPAGPTAKNDAVATYAPALACA